MRAALRASEGSRPLKIGPQIGISSEPCDGVAGPRTMPSTSRRGNVPPRRRARVVKSGGGTFSDTAAGPAPFPSRPWQVAQYQLVKIGTVERLTGQGRELRAGRLRRGCDGKTRDYGQAAKDRRVDHDQCPVQ